MEKYEYYEQACSALGVFLRPLLCSVRREIKEQTQEIRLRACHKPVLRCRGELITLEALPQLSPMVINAAFETMCEYSIYAHKNDISNGFITLRGGHRAGICGKAVLTNGTVTAYTEITSINIRIASEHNGCADTLIKTIFDREVTGILLAGEPMSGKTTVLRDIAASLSLGKTRKRMTVAIIDERNELAAVRNGKAQFESVSRCDVISGCPKDEGIMQAIRTVSPDVIICDELSSEKDAEAVEKCLNSSVPVIASVHANDFSQLTARAVTRKLLGSGAFEKTVFLRGKTFPGEIKDIISLKELKDADISGDTSLSGNSGVWSGQTPGHVAKGKSA